MRPAPLVLLALVAAACGGSDRPDAAPSRAQAGAREALPARPLGWLGARAHPLAETLEIEHDGRTAAPGGLVLTEVADGGALARAGARVGDVLVRVGEDLVPLREDPTLEVLAAFEREASGGRSEIEVGVWRGGALASLDLPLPAVALEVGLPTDVARFHEAAHGALDALLSLQREDGGFGAQDAGELVRDALASLALRAMLADASVAERVGPALARVDARLERRLADAVNAVNADAVDLALALAARSEALGALPPLVRMRLAPAVSFQAGGAGLPEGMSLPAGSFSVQLGEGEDLSALLESLGAGGGEMQIMTVSGGAAGEGDGTVDLSQLELPEGAVVMSAGTLGEGGTFEHLTGGPGQAVTLEAPPLSELLAQHDPERLPQLELLGALAQRLLATQRQDGAFGADDDTFVPTVLALVGLGAARRVGLELDAEPLARAAAALRASVNDGRVAAVVAQGGDRRVQAGRAALAAWALVEAGTLETDAVVQALLAYSDEKADQLLGSRRAPGLATLATAAVRRRRGLLDWQRFYDEFRLALLSWQVPGGAIELPVDAAADPWSARESDPTVACALGILLLQAQGATPEVLLGIAENPAVPALATAVPEATEGAEPDSSDGPR